MATDDPDAFARGPAFVGQHNTPTKKLFRVAPSTQPTTNTVRLSLDVVGCWRLNNAVFAFDSSFVQPLLADETPALATLVESYREERDGKRLSRAPVSVFGHADPSGDETYNKTLSGRRATAIYAMLVRRADLWEQLFSNPMIGDRWDSTVYDTMLATVRTVEDPTVSYLVLAKRRVQHEVSREAIKMFQQDQGSLKVDGVVGPQTREKLFLRYMDAICRTKSGDPFVMHKEEFLGKGTDDKGKGDYQGCGEFNPVLIASTKQLQDDARTSKHTERDQRNAVNRRVMVFLFRPGVPVNLSQWPCPRASEGDSGCRTMFWPDATKRRASGADEREYRSDRRTMSCRWYDQFARLSPCEGAHWNTVLLRPYDDRTEPMTNVHYRLKTGASVRSGVASGHAISLRVRNVPETCVLEWNPSSGPSLATSREPPRYSMTVYLHAQRLEGTDRWPKMLHNLGYPMEHALQEVVRAFQIDEGLKLTGELDDPTKARVEARHKALSRAMRGP